VHYRWHPLWNQQLRIVRCKTDARGRQLFYDQRDGICGALPDWMTDAVKCAAMTVGPPVVALQAAAAVVARKIRPGSEASHQLNLRIPNT
jgi:hypothetical protein